jgi:glycosyltransferase involved in cell wall biosynthesis
VSKVSILVPCYNAEKFIEEAIRSALDQDFKEKEIIVIDDGSTDQSPTILKRFGSAIKLTCRENRGGNFTRNELLSQSTGGWIQYLDADDYLAKGKLSEQMNWIDKNSGHDMVYGAVMVVYDRGYQREYDKQEVIYSDDPWAALVSWELPQTSSPLFNRQALLDVGGWNNEQKVCQEHELYFRLLKAGKSVIGVKEFNQLTHYRQWSGDTVSRKNPMNTYHARIEIMEKAYNFMEENNLLTEQRRMVFMEWCLLLSRGLWSLNKKLAVDFFKRHEKVYPLMDVRSNFLKKYYLQIVRLIGFESVERIAMWIRKIR